MSRTQCRHSADSDEEPPVSAAGRVLAGSQLSRSDVIVRCMISEEAARLRREYEEAGFGVEDLADTPMAQFDLWYSGALASGIDEPNAFVLSTATPQGLPSARAVLMKGTTSTSLIFYTNLEARKSREIKENPRVAATFVWIPLHRQVRLEGAAQLVSDQEADAYFASRPRGAQVAAHSSRQSAVVSSREEMESIYAERDASLGEVIPRPGDWGGWEITPDVVEFWQGRENRFHDRLRYAMSNGEWIVERLQP